MRKSPTTSTRPSKRKFTNYKSTTAGRPRRKPGLTNKRFGFYLTKAEERQLREWSAKYRLGVSEFLRLTVANFIRYKRDQLKVDTTYYYVRLSDGTYHPPLCELGYEFQENAQRYANRYEDATVVRMQPAAHPPGDDAPSHGGGVDAARHGG